MIEAFVLGFQEMWNSFFGPKMFDFLGKMTGAIAILLVAFSPFAFIASIQKGWAKRKRPK